MKKTITILLLALGMASLSAYSNSAAAQRGGHDNNGSNGCIKSNPRSKACEKNPNSVIETGCIWVTLISVTHPDPEIEDEVIVGALWELGDIVVFPSGAFCIIEGPPPGGIGL